MDISVVIPLYNEEESLPELFAWIQRVMDGNHFSYEVIFVNDGSTDRSWEVIENLRTQSDKVKGIKFRLITANPLHSIADSKRRKAMWLSRWMPICKTVRTKFPNSTE